MRSCEQHHSDCQVKGIPLWQKRATGCCNTGRRWLRLLYLALLVNKPTYSLENILVLVYDRASKSHCLRKSLSLFHSKVLDGMSLTLRIYNLSQNRDGIQTFVAAYNILFESASRQTRSSGKAYVMHLDTMPEDKQ